MRVHLKLKIIINHIYHIVINNLMIFAHNHPSGLAQQSQADELLTKQLKQALALVDIRVLDHFIVAGNTTFSFAERGLL
jgi:DNA repair protein RadC